jgi:uncharacterized protein YjdB
MKKNFKVLASMLTIAAFATVLVSCKDDPEPVVQVTKVTVAPSTLTKKVGEKHALTATVEPENAADKSLVWSSSAPEIAEVNASTGEVTAVNIGDATITATASNGVKGTSAITVATNIVTETGVSIDRDTIDLFVDAKQTLVATVEPENASNKAITWGSTFSQIASVNTSTGEVTAVGGGIAKVYAVTVNGLTDTCVVRVTLPLTGIAFDAASTESLVLIEGARHQITATPVPPSATNYNPVWSSSDEAVAIVTQEGLVTAIYEGTAVITLTSDTVSKSITIIVNPELPRAKLFDLAFREDKTAYDASPNNLTILEGPAKPTVEWNTYYGRYEAIIHTPKSKNYVDDPLYGTVDYSSWASETYQDYRHRERPAEYPDPRTLGEKSMGFYKIPWSNNQPMYDAYTNAFSYELVFMVPVRLWTSSEHFYLFGNLNPSHSGFGIMLWCRWGSDYTDPPSPIGFTSIHKWAEGSMHEMTTPYPLEAEKYYHVIVTYDRHSTTELKALYVDGEKVASETENLGEYMFLPVDYYWGELNNMRDRGYEPGVTPRQDWMENLWIAGVAHQSGYPNTAEAPNNTHFVIARVYDKALTATEVSALYQAVTK